MLTDSLLFPPLPTVELGGAREFLDPASDLWGKYPPYEGGPCGGHRGWRLAMVLVAMYGMSTIETTTDEVAGLLGTNTSQANNYLLALGKANPVVKTSRGEWTVHLQNNDVGDTRMEHTVMNAAHQRRAAWKSRLTGNKDAAT